MATGSWPLALPHDLFIGEIDIDLEVLNRSSCQFTSLAGAVARADKTLRSRRIILNLNCRYPKMVTYKWVGGGAPGSLPSSRRPPSTVCRLPFAVFRPLLIWYLICFNHIHLLVLAVY